MDPDAMRMVERIIAVLGGVLSIYLGYRLFFLAATTDHSSGAFKSAIFNVTLTKVGPGVFFALFGAFIIGLSYYKPVSISQGPQEVDSGRKTSGSPLAFPSGADTPGVNLGGRPYKFEGSKLPPQPGTREDIIEQMRRGTNG